MRMKTVRQMYLDFVIPSSPTKVVAAYRMKYGALNALLVANPAVLELVHSDFCRWLSTSQKGRRSDYTSEEILRCLVVMFVEQDSYRDVVVRIENSDFLRSFVGLGFAKPMMDFSFVGKAFAALSGETWHAVNQSLARHAKKKAWISGEKLRTDSTAYESNIHYPTDSSLLWDSFRVLCRTLRRLQKACPKLGLTHRYHDKKVKKLAFYIARKAGKPVEFGHKVLLAQTGEKFITHYKVMPEREEDKDLLNATLDAHRSLFGKLPDTLAADKGFYASVKQLAGLEKKIKTVSICKKGRRTKKEEEREHSDEFKAGQAFRAGVEGTISVLKRAFKLNRCLFKGYKNFASSVGCAVFCHNLVLLAET